MYRIKEDAEEYAMFLDQISLGCASGRFDEWVQLRSACRWALDEIKRLQLRIQELESR